MSSELELTLLSMSGLWAKDLVNGTVRQRDHEEVAVGTGLNICADSKVSADE